MSKRHKHRINYKLEQRCAYLELQRQIVILILIILMYRDRNEPNNYEIICSTREKDSTTYMGGGIEFSAEPKLVKKQVSAKEGEEVNAKANFSGGKDKVLHVQETEHRVENYNIIGSPKKENLTSYTEGGITFSAESELMEMPVSVQMGNEGNLRVNFTDDIDSSLQSVKTEGSAGNHKITYSTNKKKTISNTGGIVLNTESELMEMPVSKQTSYEGNERVNYNDGIDNNLKVQINKLEVEEKNNSSNNNILESINALQQEPIIISSNITVLNVETVTCSPMDDLDQCESQVVISVPVLLSNINIETFVEALTKFPEQVFKIKDMDKRVIIKDCRLIPGTNKLFIEGIIAENVEYTNEGSVEKDSINGKVKKVIFDIPFKASEVVTFLTKPIDSEKYSDLEVEFLNVNESDAEINEQSSLKQEFPNKSIFGELNSIEIWETDIQEEIRPIQDSFNDMHTFEKVRKKIVVKIGLSLLQKREIFISSSTINKLNGNIETSKNI